MIKETGFMSIPKESFPIKEDVESYTKFTVKITLNDAKLRSSGQNRTLLKSSFLQ